MDEHRAANRKHWDEVTAIHVASDLYDLDSFRAGGIRLHSLERGELGDVAGKTLLHLQCHFGLDTLSWARLGATVTGVDFSAKAIEQARALAKETAVDARFVVCELYDLPSHLDETFDVVYTSYGAIYWLPDIEAWARLVARYLRPGGTFYIAEFHPTGFVFDNTDPEVQGWHVRYPYFWDAEPTMDDSPIDYADPGATFENRVTYGWAHTLGGIVTALIEAGLSIEYVHEFPYTVYRQFSFTEKGDDGFWHVPAGMIPMPLLFSIKAHKP